MAARTEFEVAATNGDLIGISAISLAEIVYRGEKGRIHQQVFGRLLEALDQSEAVLHVLSFDRTAVEVMARIERDLVPDLPERVIAATAQFAGVPLITRGRQIRLAGLPTIW